MHSENRIIYRQTVCPLDCPDSCGMVATVDNGAVTTLNGASDHPYTKGFICRKMRTYPERVYAPERIRHPMVRTGPKGTGQFKKTSWPEALQRLADKLVAVQQTHGGEAILPYQYAGNMGVINRNAGYPLYHKIGASRLEETICSAAAKAGWSLHLGDVPGSPPEVAEDADLIVAWGINLKVTNIHFWQSVVAAKQRGAELVVIDPYRTETAKAADHFIQVAPGGDGALALGVIKSLLEQQGIDRQALAEHTTGFEALERYLDRTPWQAFTRMCGLDKETIQWVARQLQAHPKTFIRMGMGLSRNSRGGMNVRAIVSLAAALGLFSGGDGQGVLLFTQAFRGDSDKLRFPELLPRPTRRINMAHLGYALTAIDPPVHLLMVYNCNPLCVAPDASMVRKGLLREDLYTVVHEQVLTPTARYADLLLPATTFLENRDLYTGYGHFQLAVVDPVIAPVGECKSNFDLFRDLAATLGYSDPPLTESLETRLTAYMDTIAGLPRNFTFTPGQTTGWLTSTRKRIGQSIMRRWQVPVAFQADGNAQVPAIACLLEADEFSDPDLCTRFPFQLITPPHKDLLNSTFGERYLGRFGRVLIHPDDAHSHSVTDGCVVKLSNHRGTVQRVAKVTPDTQKGLLVAEGLFWQTGEHAAGINDLTSQKTTDIGAGPTFHETRVALAVVLNQAS